ncbi:MAG TPA: H-X9-DG-CTERM domain-containing protein [Tepidisphaeraceae bacterium]|jgi:prepilin-type processing-associated H-X9-DG protein
MTEGPGNYPYIYRGAGLTDAVPADIVLLYEPLQNHGSGINVLHADGSVEWLDRKDAIAFLDRLRSATGPARSQPSMH